jgi:acetylornithine deacetylase
MAPTPALLELAQTLIAFPSPFTESNQAIAAYLATLLTDLGFAVEELAYLDDGKRKVSLVARLGEGTGGLGFFSHTDTVTPNADGWDPYTPTVQDGKLIGRGACDMKGPLAATVVAAAAFVDQPLQRPLTLVLTADEEIGYGGAKQVVTESRLLREIRPTYGVIAEPTRLRPVYAHKGGARIHCTAYGRAAHTSTDAGISANFRIAPFLAEMAELNQLFRREARFQNPDFDPPTNGFNMVIDDGGTPSNVTAAKTVCTLGIRPMPHDASQEAIDLILAAAARHNLETDWYLHEPFAVPPHAPIIQAALAATGRTSAETVPFGTEAAIFKDLAQLVILGPGDIAQAHTVGEWIDLAQLTEAVEVYRQMIHHFCLPESRP